MHWPHKSTEDESFRPSRHDSFLNTLRPEQFDFLTLHQSFLGPYMMQEVLTHPKLSQNHITLPELQKSDLSISLVNGVFSRSLDIAPAGSLK